MNNNIDIGELKKDIQDFFQDGTLTIVGSGLSSAEGIPGMEKLAIELKKKMPKKLKEGSRDKEIWDKIAEKLSQNVGLEAALLNMGLPENEEVEKHIRRITADYIEKAEQNVLRKILNGNKALRFSEYINCFGENKDHVVITTNYDRLIEYACEICGRRIDTLCEGKYISNFNPQYRRNNLYSNETKRNGRQHTGFAPKVTILKPHGCLSWHMINDEPFYSPYFNRQVSPPPL